MSKSKVAALTQTVHERAKALEAGRLAEFDRLARAAARGADLEPEAVLDACAAVGRTAADFQEAAERYARRAELAAVLGTLPAAEAELAEANRLEAELRAERARADELFDARERAAVSLRRAAAAKMQQVEIARAELRRTVPPDLAARGRELGVEAERVARSAHQVRETIATNEKLVANTERSQGLREKPDREALDRAAEMKARLPAMRLELAEFDARLAAIAAEQAEIEKQTYAA